MKPLPRPERPLQPRMVADASPLAFLLLFAAPAFATATLQRQQQLRGRLAADHRGGSASSFYAYDYSARGQDWTMGVCSSRQRQSPIDFNTAAGALPAPPLTYRYLNLTAPFEIENTGLTYSADFGSMGLGGVALDGAWYDLLNINVHALSEHTWDGQHRPVELHLVHKRYDGDALLVVAIPVDAASAAPAAPPAALGGVVPPVPNAAVTGLFRGGLPASLAKVLVPADEAQPLDLNALLQGGTYLDYKGSMTAPPCAETVTWLVRSSPVIAADAEVNLLRNSVFGMTNGQGNFREAMPLNGRVVVSRPAVYEAPLLAAESPAAAALTAASGAAASPVSAAGAAAPAAVAADAKAMKVANQALGIARQATDAIQAMDAQLAAVAAKSAQATAAAASAPPATPPLAAAPVDLQSAVNAAAAAATQQVVAAVDASAKQAAQGAVADIVAALRRPPATANQTGQQR